jgi:hypothetical protein
MFKQMVHTCALKLLKSHVLDKQKVLKIKYAWDLLT